MIVQLAQSAPQSTPGWQIAATVVTALGTVAAIAFGIMNMIQRRNDNKRRDAEDAARALAQARLVITGRGNPGAYSLTDDPDGNLYAMDFPFANHGDRPVLDVYPEIWREMEPGNPESVTRYAVHQFVVKSGEDTTLTMKFPFAPGGPGYSGWLIRWTDADGNEWCRDSVGQEVPRRYTGQRPNNQPTSRVIAGQAFPLRQGH